MAWPKTREAGQALANPARRQILALMQEVEAPVAPVDINRALGGQRKDLTLVSHHMKYLRDAGLIRAVDELCVSGSNTGKHLFEPTEDGSSADALAAIKALDALARDRKES
jgi:DNA-binding transcriptional ArsR family regulator